MVDLPNHDVRYPDRDTGRQGLDRPPPPEQDNTLLAILADHRGNTIREVHDAIRAAGYTHPTPVHHWADLMDYPPRALLTDGRGLPWSAEAIPEEMWDDRGPWQLVYTPPIEDVPNTA